MYVIEVIPLKRAVSIETLSYFSKTAYEPGTILSVPVRNKEIRGIVLTAESVSGAKTALRAATFSLKKLPEQKDLQTLSPALIETAKDLAEYYATQPGAVLYQLLPPEVRDGKIPLPHTHTATPQEKAAPEVFQATDKERYLAYRSMVRSAFAHAGSVLFVVPSSAEAAYAEEVLGNGVEDRTIVLSTAITPKKLKAAYERLEDFSKPKLIIATPSHALLERHDITTIIVEHAHSVNYRERTRPFLDMRHVLKVHATHTARRVIYGSLMPRAEEEHYRREEIYGTHGETPKRLLLPGKLEIIKMKDKPDATTPFKLFSDKALAAIEETHKKKGKTFLFAARRGLAPVVACGDCGHIFRSPESGAPYSLFRTKKDGQEERWFLCSVSGTRVRAADTCPECGSWRLRERGIGIQHIYDELEKTFPDIPLILFDHTSASTYKKACFLQEKFYSTKGAVMLGTQMALPYLTAPIDTAIVTSMDALRATPTWRQEEDTLGTLLKLREETSGSVLIQTRTEPDDLLEYARTGSTERFYTEEIALRKQFKYPPYAHFIHLTWQGNEQSARQTEELVRETLAPWKPTIYAAPPSTKGGIIMYALVKRPKKEWPEPQLLAALRSLPPSIRVIMNPDRIV